MRIAYFLVAFPVVSETFILNQITGMIDRGHDIDIYARKPRVTDTVHEEIDKYKLCKRAYYFKKSHNNIILRTLVYLKLVTICLFKNRSHLLLKLYRARNEISNSSLTLLNTLSFALHISEQKPYDIIHCQFGTLGPIALLLKKIGVLNGKMVISFRGSDISKHELFNSHFYNNLLDEYDLVLPVSEAIRQRLLELGCHKHKIHVLHSGINLKKFQFHERIYNKQYPVRLISIARLVEKKGLIYAVQAISRAIKSGKNIDYKIIGDGELRDKLEDLIKKSGASENIRLLGWKNHDEVIRLLEESDMMLAPSVTAENGDQEGIPNAAKEAMAMGIPVVSTLHGGIPELVEDGISGFLVPERDAEALYDRIMYLCDHPEVWPGMGRAGRLHIEAEFDINKLNDELERLYMS